METILKISRKILYRSRSHPPGIYIQALFLALDLASRARLSEPAAEDPVPGRSTHQKLATPRMRQPEGLLGVHRQLSRISCQLSLPIRREARARLTHLDDGRSRHPSLVNLLTVADHEQVRNLPMPGKWPQRRACVPDWSRKCDRPVVTVATAREVGAITQAVSVRIAKDPLCCPRHPRSTLGSTRDEIERLADRYVSSRRGFRQ
jgi:hypothetical protein